MVEQSDHMRGAVLDETRTYFAAGTVFEGTITAPGDIWIDGEVKGEIVSDGKVSIHKMGDSSIAARDLELLGAVIKGDIIVKGEVTVDEDSAVQGNIRSSSIICAGAVQGNLTAVDYVSLKEHSKVLGNINAPSMMVDNGAMICGQVLIGNEGASSPVY